MWHLSIDRNWIFPSMMPLRGDFYTKNLETAAFFPYRSFVAHR